jgi:hypothetical protein
MLVVYKYPCLYWVFSKGQHYIFSTTRKTIRRNLRLKARQPGREDGRSRGGFHATLSVKTERRRDEVSLCLSVSIIEGGLEIEPR